MSQTYEPRSIKAAPFCWGEKEALRMIHGAFSETDNLPSGYAVYTALTMIASDEQSETFTVRKALIAFKAGVSIRTAGDVLKRFEAMRLVGVARHSTTGTTPDGASTYTLRQVSNGCTGVGNGCSPVGNQPERSFIADKVEESKKNLSEESQNKLPPAPSAAVVEEIYQAYPRKKKPVDARKAIGKALMVVAKRGNADPATWLKERVVAFANARRGEDSQFTPYPSSWFNAGSYDEDFGQPAQGTNGANGHGKPRSEPPVDLRASCDPADFASWLRQTFPKANLNLTPHTATHEIVLQYVAQRPSN